jgi:hypothetical protein
MLYDLKREQRAKQKQARLAEQLDKVVFIIEHGGWCQGREVEALSDGRYAHCLVGAVAAACGEGVGRKDCYEALAVHIPEERKYYRNARYVVVNYNDHPSTSCTDILNLIHATRDAARL